MKKKVNFLITLLAAVLLLSGCTDKAKNLDIIYPVTEKCDQVDDYFGTKVADPYRWLEDDKDEKVKKWVQEQNKVTFAYLENIPYREKILKRMREVYNYPTYSSPSKAGEYYFFYKNDGLQDQDVIYIQKGLDGEPEVFLDPNKLSEDGTISASLCGLSKDNRYTAYSRSEGGSDWQEIRVMEIATKKELTDRIQWTKFSGASWFGDGFFYGGYDKPEAGKELTAANRFQKIFYHKLGDPQEKDRVIYEDKEHPRRYYNADVTEDQKHLLLHISEGTHGNETYCKDLTREDSGFRLLVKGFDSNTYMIDNIDDKFLAQTDVDAPKNRVVLIDSKNPARENWKTLIPEKEDTLQSVRSAGGKLFVSYLKDASTRVYRHDLSGAFEKEITLPAMGTAHGFAGKKEDKTLFYEFASFTYPSTIYKYDVTTGKSEVFRKSEVKFKPADFETKQVFYKSKDGTTVPMFLVYKKGLKLDGTNPAYLYGYGGFTAGMTPYFRSSNIILLENGCVYAVACIRGGNEYGEEWHKAGILLKKQNVFDDFIAAAEYLIKEKYTAKDKLAIAGASNGGLLVGACMNQRPGLFKVALPAVGVMDMLRYHKFTVGWGWAVEYGSSDTEEHFKNLYSYSPLHNIKEGVAYPATLVTTADHDDRVVPAHSFKFIATLQEKHKGANPVLARIETRSGHGSSNLTKAIEIRTDVWAFMFYNMGIEPIY